MTTRPAPNRDYSPIFEIIPATTTDTAQDVTTKDAFLMEVQVTVPSTASAAVRVIVSDKQGTPIAAIDQNVLPGEYFTYPFNDRPMVGGISVTGDGANVWIKWKQ